MEHISSPNFNVRPEGAEIDMLVLHYTGMPTAQDALDRMCDPKAEVSSHYMVEETGNVIALVDEDKRAWHAGVSKWRGRDNINHYSIGIEIVNPGHEFGYSRFPAEQMEAVAELCLSVLGRYKIPSYNIVGHSDIAPLRKQDPGERFDWKWMAEKGVGVFPDIPKKTPYEDGVEIGMRNDRVYDLQSRMRKYGYSVEVDGYFGPNMSQIVQAFQRRFMPIRLDGIWDTWCDYRLNKLLKVK